MMHLQVHSSIIGLMVGKECRYVSVREWGIWSLARCPLQLRLGDSRSAAGFTSISPFMILYIMFTLSDVLLDCIFSSWICATNVESLEVELKSRRMRRAERHCTISSEDLRCCWWGSHTTAAYSGTSRTRLL